MPLSGASPKVNYKSGDLILLGFCMGDPRLSTTGTTGASLDNTIKTGWQTLFTLPAGTSLVYKLAATLTNNGTNQTTTISLKNVTDNVIVTGSSCSYTSVTANDSNPVESGELALVPATKDYIAYGLVTANTGSINNLRVNVYAKVN